MVDEPVCVLSQPEEDTASNVRLDGVGVTAPATVLDDDDITAALWKALEIAKVEELDVSPGRAIVCVCVIVVHPRSWAVGQHIVSTNMVVVLDGLTAVVVVNNFTVVVVLDSLTTVVVFIGSKTIVETR